MYKAAMANLREAGFTRQSTKREPVQGEVYILVHRLGILLISLRQNLG